MLRGCIHRKDAAIDSNLRTAHVVKTREHRITSAVLALMIVEGIAPSWAATDGDAVSSASSLEEVTVTAQKRSENLQDVPLAVSTIGGEALVDRQVNNLLDLQGLAPNTTLQQRLSSGVVTIRGIGFDIITAGTDSSVAIQTDGCISRDRRRRLPVCMTSTLSKMRCMIAPRGSSATCRSVCR